MKKLVIISMVLLVAMFTLGLSPSKANKTHANASVTQANANKVHVVKATEDQGEDDTTWEEDTWSEEDPFSLETIEIPANFDDLKANANKVLEEVKKNTSKEPSEYHRFKNEIDVIDDKLDLYDDALEVQYTDGKIKAEDYRKLESSIDAIDDILDKAEDMLEKQFGFGD